MRGAIHARTAIRTIGGRCTQSTRGGLLRGARRRGSRGAAFRNVKWRTEASKTLAHGEVTVLARRRTAKP